MKKLLFAVLFAGALTVLGSQAKAHDGCYDNEDRYSSSERYGYRESVRYERPRYRYDEEDVVIVRPRHRAVVEDDYGYRPRYSEHRYHHDSLLSVFFGF